MTLEELKTAWHYEKTTSFFIMCFILFLGLFTPITTIIIISISMIFAIICRIIYGIKTNRYND